MSAVDYDALPGLLRADGSADLMKIGMLAQEGKCPVWEDLAAECLRLRAAAQEQALQYLADTGQLEDQITALRAEVAALTDANAALRGAAPTAWIYERAKYFYPMRTVLDQWDDWETTLSINRPHGTANIRNVRPLFLAPFPRRQRRRK